MERRTPRVKTEIILKRIVEFIGYFVILMSLIVIVIGAIKKEVYLLGGTVLLPMGIATIFFAKRISIVRKQ